MKAEDILKSIPIKVPLYEHQKKAVLFILRTYEIIPPEEVEETTDGN